MTNVFKRKDFMAKKNFKNLKELKEFNIVVAGQGGQGIMTLQEIITGAARGEGFDVRTSELHGLSQRGGSVESHIRFGKEIFSPLVKQGGADLIISLEAQEAVKSCYYGSKENKTTFLVNTFLSPIIGQKSVSLPEISKPLKMFSGKVFLVPASDICQKELANPVVSGIYLLGFAVFKGLLPLKRESVLAALKQNVPEKHLELNLKAFDLAGNQRC